MTLTEPERLALALVVAGERDRERFLERRAGLADFAARLAATDRPLELTAKERTDIAYLARREIETNRSHEAPHLEPLRTAFAKLAPADAPPEPPRSPRRKGARRR